MIMNATQALTTIMADQETLPGNAQRAPAGDVQETAFSGNSGRRVLAPDLLRGFLMILQAIDHCALTVGAWEHGVAIRGEADDIFVSEWNEPVAYTARMLTHLCAPGFMFLLGMGIVYFGQSRTKLGWSSLQLARHFAIRAFALAAVNQFFITLPAGAFKYWLVNPVLIALAINYLLAGLLWLSLGAFEAALANLLAPSDPERQPLLGSSTSPIPWHVHNVLLAILTAVTAWWNIALSPTHGHCTGSSGDLPFGPPHEGPFDFWFYPVLTEHVMSGFPPLAWLSFAILGLLYGRIVTARQWRPYALTTFSAIAAATLFLLFIFTRLFRFGNLSEDCLGMPEQLAHPDRNQYLASFRSFLYIVKYPPSVAFFAFTMAVNFLFLALFSLLTRIWLPLKPLVVYGTSALFFYVIHLLLYTAIGAVVKKWFGHPIGGTDPFTGEPKIGVGDGAAMWASWLFGLVLLYPLCEGYGRFKSSKAPDSVWRFF